MIQSPMIITVVIGLLSSALLGSSELQENNVRPAKFQLIRGTSSVWWRPQSCSTYYDGVVQMSRLRMQGLNCQVICVPEQEDEGQARLWSIVVAAQRVIDGDDNPINAHQDEDYRTIHRSLLTSETPFDAQRVRSLSEQLLFAMAQIFEKQDFLLTALSCIEADFDKESFLMQALDSVVQNLGKHPPYENIFWERVYKDDPIMQRAHLLDYNELDLEYIIRSTLMLLCVNTPVELIEVLSGFLVEQKEIPYLHLDGYFQMVEKLLDLCFVKKMKTTPHIENALRKLLIAFACCEVKCLAAFEMEGRLTLYTKLLKTAALIFERDLQKQELCALVDSSCAKNIYSVRKHIALALRKKAESLLMCRLDRSFQLSMNKGQQPKPSGEFIDEKLKKMDPQKLHACYLWKEASSSLVDFYDNERVIQGEVASYYFKSLCADLRAWGKRESTNLPEVDIEQILEQTIRRDVEARDLHKKKEGGCPGRDTKDRSVLVSREEATLYGWACWALSTRPLLGWYVGFYAARFSTIMSPRVNVLDTAPWGKKVDELQQKKVQEYFDCSVQESLGACRDMTLFLQRKKDDEGLLHSTDATLCRYGPW